VECSNSATSLRPSCAAKCCAFVVFAKSQISIAVEQSFDLCQITSLGCVMNLAGEGEATPSQYDQAEQRDGDEARNWGVAGSIEG